MTGYAVASRESGHGTLTIELKSVNSRFLDLQFRINDDLRAFEPALREAIIQRVARGKVECRVSFGRKAAGSSQALNAELLATLMQMQGEIRKAFPDAATLSVAELLRWPGVVEEAQASQDSLQAELNAVLADAMRGFVDSRQREGAALQAMLLSRVDEMEKIVARITPLMPQAIAQFQQKAVERMQEALSASTQGSLRDEAMERVRQEVTLYAVRMDVAEELTRLAAHLAETRAILAKGGQTGKRLDFMMQELNREANTLGSKAALKDLSDAAMALKLLIEQMREQVQNLE
ncbi:YicC/YloC family endoribonuclease [Lacisediminimonas profundi]|uniref:YicC/YloC family endoribonuclease n=1 Tax=Lacisediminimonas profundi TaxID=2603856 RepID=UPI00124B3EC3|nr:YicC/YloC family endoribonuclease [Lacisediminimonas profundi]